MPPTASDRRVGRALVVMAAVWGSSCLSAKVAVAAGGVLVVLALRCALSAAALAVVAAARRPPRPDRAQVGVGVAPGCSQAAVLALETYGLVSTSATHAGVLIALTIVVTPAMRGALGTEPLWAVAIALLLGGSPSARGPGPQPRRSAPGLLRPGLTCP